MEFKVKKAPQAIDPESISIKMNAWPDCYYKEMDPAVRRLLLDEAERLDLTPEGNEVREFLFEKRYQRGKNGYTDSFLKVWMEFKFMNGSGISSLNLKRNRKRLRDLFDELGETKIREAGSPAVEILSREYEHSGLTYITLSATDPSYRSVIFGLGTVSEERLFSRIYRDFILATVTIPEQLGMTEEISLWTEAVKRSLRTAYPDTKI